MMSHFYHVIVLISNHGRTFSRSSLIFLKSQQELASSEFGLPAGTDRKPISIGLDNQTTIVGNRDRSQSPHLLRSLPQKRSNQSLTSGSSRDSEESRRSAFPISYSVKRFKGPITPPSSSPLTSCKSVVTAGFSRPIPDFSEAVPLLLERAEATDDQLESDRPKPLRSPFEYTRELATSQINQNVKREIQRFGSRRPLLSGNSLRYIYFAPTNSSDTQALDKPRRIPHRQLLYCDTFSKPGPRSLHKSTGSWGLRHEAERHADYNFECRSNSTSYTSTDRSLHSEPRWSRSRLWSELLEQENEIKEAVSIQKLGRRQKSSPKSVLMI